VVRTTPYDLEGFPSCGPETVPAQTGRMTDGAQAVVVARIRGAASLGLVPPPSAEVVPATVLADPAWTAEMLAVRGRAARSRDLRVLATVWWYSVSTVLVTPALAGLVAGVPLSARLEDITLALLPGAQPIAAVASAGGTDVVADLRAALESVIPAVAEAGRMRARPLWALATDSLANQLLAIGRAVGDVPAATALAGPVAAGIGPPLPAPRYIDVGAARFTRRASCCLLYRLPDQPLCTSCPRRPPAERAALLERAARWF
jgi:ferric iron reductase protein FhuF